MKSVVVPLSTKNKRLLFDVKELAKAQKTAIDLELPLAVVFCFSKFENWSQKDFINLYIDLLRIESDLAPFNIRLVVMVGSAEEKLPKLYSHIDPKIETFGQSGNVVKHPYDWTGVWFSIEYLRPRFEQEIGYNLG